MQVRGSRSEGFTIVETIIVLAVTSFLFVTVAAIIGNKQSQTQFASGTRDFQTRLQQVINDVSSGYYLSSDNILCDDTGLGGAPNPRQGATAEGTNKECIFLGKAIQFDVDGADPQKFNVYSVVGLREKSDGVLAQNLTDAKPRLVKFNGSYDEFTMPYGLTVEFVKSGGTNFGALAFLSNLNDVDALANTSQQIDAIPVKGTNLGKSVSEGVDQIETNSGSDADGLAHSTINPATGVGICVSANDTKHWALYTIGGAGRQLNVSFAVKTNASCT